MQIDVPLTRARKIDARDKSVEGGIEWNGVRFQTREKDCLLISGRVGKINALLALGRITLTDTSYTDRSGQVRPFAWRAEDDSMHLFTAAEFIEFGIAVDELVEDAYQESWQ